MLTLHGAVASCWGPRKMRPAVVKRAGELGVVLAWHRSFAGDARNGIPHDALRAGDAVDLLGAPSTDNKGNIT